MKKFVPILSAFLLVACGGGGSSTSSTPSPASANYTYFEHAGLKWSSTSATKYQTVPLGSSLPLTESKGFFCNGTVDGVLKNFNGEAGWRLPTLVELQGLYQGIRNPPGFVSGPVWTGGNFAVDFATGNTIISGNTEESRYHVTCVKAL